MREGRRREEKWRGRREKGEGRREKSGLRCGVLRCVVLFGAVCLLVCLSVSASPCLLCSPVLSCAVDNTMRPEINSNDFGGFRN